MLEKKSETEHDSSNNEISERFHLPDDTDPIIAML
jgi:hypothetical protein